MFKKILLGFVLVVAVFAVVVALKSPDFRYVRSSTMAVPPAVPFAQVNDFHNWGAWSPWAKLDPTMKQTFEGAPSGVGAVYTWAGDMNVGEGRMTITESRPNEVIKIKLKFLKPFPGINDTVFTFKPEGNQTTVTWDMVGKTSFIPRAFGMFVDMDKMIGDMFDQGLAQMKTIVEVADKK